ncbi:MAG: hypothetical protein HPY90_00510 [Syntrophothermus sp.]|uniref:hypothetical protein n=1 Tax=Syntrophothermus sp. TaxID=2736299 RepID=UPI00257BC18F|nr:hypothetical protein [Syntrophothermus sp.]NSW81745.1 hypothetical protein [Syntrophothermus sp.]
MEPELSKLKEACQAVLNSLLGQLRNEIEELTSVQNLFLPSGTVDIEVLEDYLYHVNSFYYRAFDQKMIPVYIEKVNRMMAEIYRVSRQGEQVKNDLVSNLVRCAGLSNLLKHFTQVLSDLEQVIQQELKALTDNRMRVNRQLIEVVEDLTSEIRSLEQQFNIVEKIQRDAEWAELIKSDVNLLPVVCWWVEGWTAEPGARIRDEVGRWLGQAETFIQMLEDVAAPPRESRLGDSWPGLLEKALALGRALEFSSSLRNLIRETIGAWLEFEAERLGFYQRQVSSNKMAEHTARFAEEARHRLGQWVKIFRCLLRFSREGLEPEMLSEFRWMRSLAGDYAGSIARLLREFQRELEALADKLQRYPDLSPLELEKLFEETVYRYEQELRERWSRANLPRPSRFGYRVEYTLEYLELIDVKLRYHRERLQMYLEAQGRYREVAEGLRRCRQLFSGFGEDVDNLLSPRTLKRAWKDLPVEVRRYPIKVGEKLPPECLPVLDKGYVERKPVSEKEHLVVLEEKGDVFWIQVDGIERWEVPYLVVGMKR